MKLKITSFAFGLSILMLSGVMAAVEIGRATTSGGSVATSSRYRSVVILGQSTPPGVSSNSLHINNAGFAGLIQSSARTPIVGGLPYWWLIEHFGSTNAIDGGASDDWDHDGRTNMDEFISGTDPTDPTSIWGASASSVTPSGDQYHFVITWPSTYNRLYRIDRGGDLRAQLGPHVLDIIPTPPMNVYTDVVDSAESMLFYKINVHMAD